VTEHTRLTDGERNLLSAVEGAEDALIALTQELVRIPSENVPPSGGELAAQEFIHRWLADVGVESELIPLDAVSGLYEHELFFRGEGCERRDYRGRPNLAARLRGQGEGPRLIVSGHIDTMPIGRTRWQHDPLGGEVAHGRLYGRGSFDMKGGVAAAMMAVKMLHEAGAPFSGEVILETVVDEEHAGANGTLANRLAGYAGDAVIVPEPSNLQVFHAHKGFRIVHLTLRGKSGMGLGGEELANPVEHIGILIDGFKLFRERRRQTAPIGAEYEHESDPTPVFMNKLQAGRFSLDIPMQIPESCTLEIYWQTLPGETQEEVESKFFEFLSEWVASHPELGRFSLDHRFSHRWMPGTRTPREAPIVRAVEGAASVVLDAPPRVVGAPYPCDMFVFDHFGIPGVIFGPSGGNGHGSDEYVETDSLVRLTRALVLTAVRFCRAAED
jgi:acetylornithine deacetylase